MRRKTWVVSDHFSDFLQIHGRGAQKGIQLKNVAWKRWQTFGKDRGQTIHSMLSLLKGHGLHEYGHECPREFVDLHPSPILYWLAKIRSASSANSLGEDGKACKRGRASVPFLNSYSTSPQD